MNLLDARRIFGDLDVVQVATTRPDGSPHCIPLWFTWRDEAIYVSCRRDSVTWRAVERDQRVALTFHVGQSWNELAGALVYGRADPLAGDHPALRGVMSAWFEKYRALLAGEGFRQYAREVEAPGILRVRPHRLISWDHAVNARRATAEHDAR